MHSFCTIYIFILYTYWLLSFLLLINQEISICYTVYIRLDLKLLQVEKKIVAFLIVN